MTNPAKIQRVVLSLGNDRLHRFLATYSKQEADELWAMTAAGEYWVDGYRFLTRGEFSRDDRIQCEQLALINNNKREAMKNATKRKGRLKRLG